MGGAPHYHKHSTIDMQQLHVESPVGFIRPCATDVELVTRESQDFAVDLEERADGGNIR